MTKKDKADERVVLNHGYYAEALDRVYCIQYVLEDLIEGHPVVLQTPAFKKLAAAAADNLRDLYLAIGAKL